jgi:heat shock protein HslJ
MKQITGLLLFALISILPGCRKDDLNKALISTKWYLKSIQNTDTRSEIILPENFSGMYVEFSDSNTLHAISSCNVFDGFYETKSPDIINVTDLGSTKMYCNDPARREWESYFYENLKSSSKFIFKDGTLSIRTNINTVMIFK